jgi:polyhydroxyalkanoate synthesis regulator phasin
MKEILRKKDGTLTEKESGQVVGDEDILDLIREDEAFRITDESTGADVTQDELTQLLIRRTREKPDFQKIMENLKSGIESGRTTLGQVLQDLFFAGYGALVTTEQKLREAIEQLVASGKVSKEKGEEFLARAKETLRTREKEAEQKIRTVMNKMLSEIGISTREELDQKINQIVEKRIQPLEKELKAIRKQLDSLEK